MSLRARMLNGWLRAVEKPRMRRAKHPAPLRRALEVQSRMFFHAPRGTAKKWIKLGEIDALEIRPRSLTDSKKVLFYVHGGGFTFGSPNTHSALAAQLAFRLKVRAVLPRYRLAPEHPYPAAPDDVRAAWDGLIAQGVAPGDVVIGGDSAGGALAFGLLAQLCHDGADMPGCVFGFSPLTDASFSAPSFKRNAQADAVLPVEAASQLSQMFLGDQPPDDPRISPQRGNFHGAPSVWITVGDTEILQDDAHLLIERCKAQGVSATLVERHDLPHVWPIFHNILPEARQTLDQLAGSIRQQRMWAGES